MRLSIASVSCAQGRSSQQPVVSVADPSRSIVRRMHASNALASSSRPTCVMARAQQAQQQPPSRPTPTGRIGPSAAGPPRPDRIYQQSYPQGGPYQRPYEQPYVPPPTQTGGGPPGPPGGGNDNGNGPVKDFLNNYAKALIAGAFVCGLGVGVSPREECMCMHPARSGWCMCMVCAPCMQGIFRTPSEAAWTWSSHGKRTWHAADHLEGLQNLGCKYVSVPSCLADHFPSTYGCHACMGTVGILRLRGGPQPSELVINTAH